MLTEPERKATSLVLKENYRRLAYTQTKIAADLQVDEAILEKIVAVNGAHG